MNKYEKAKYDFKAVRLTLEENNHYHFEIALAILNSLEKKHLKLVERATSIKQKYNICNVCGEAIETDSNYCSHCGQALDWSE